MPARHLKTSHTQVIHKRLDEVRRARLVRWQLSKRDTYISLSCAIRVANSHEELKLAKEVDLRQYVKTFGKLKDAQTTNFLHFSSPPTIKDSLLRIAMSIVFLLLTALASFVAAMTLFATSGLSHPASKAPLAAATPRTAARTATSGSKGTATTGWTSKLSRKCNRYAKETDRKKCARKDIMITASIGGAGVGIVFVFLLCFVCLVCFDIFRRGV